MRIIRKASIVATLAVAVTSCGTSSGKNENRVKTSAPKAAETFTDVDAPQYMLIPADGSEGAAVSIAADGTESSVQTLVRDDQEMGEGSTQSFYYGSNCRNQPWLCRPTYNYNNSRVGYGYAGSMWRNNRRYNCFQRAHLSYWNGQGYQGAYYNQYQQSPYWNNSYYGQAYNSYQGQYPYSGYGAYNGGYALPGYSPSTYSNYYQSNQSSFSSYQSQGGQVNPYVGGLQLPYPAGGAYGQF